MISSGGPVRVWKYINRGGRNWSGRRGGADVSDNVRTARPARARNAVAEEEEEEEDKREEQRNRYSTSGGKE